MQTFEAYDRPVPLGRFVGRDEGFAIALVDSGVDGSAMGEAAVLAGARVVARFAIDDAADGLARLAKAVVVGVEVAGIAPDRLGDALAAIRTVVRTLDLPLVLALEPDQIDVVVATLGSTRAELLCAPSAAELVAALVLAAGRMDEQTLSDRAREGEGERLRVLNDEVARIAQVLTRLSRRRDEATSRGDVAERRPTFQVEPGDATMPAIDAAEIRQLIRARRLRDQFFGTGLFEDPAWDMLLDLFAADLERARVSVSSLCIAAAVAPTTALRWIGRMTDAGLLERQPDPFDRRRAFMALSPRARTGMTGYVEAVQRAGLTLA